MKRVCQTGSLHPRQQRTLVVLSLGTGTGPIVRMVCPGQKEMQPAHRRRMYLARLWREEGRPVRYPRTLHHVRHRRFVLPSAGRIGRPHGVGAWAGTAPAFGQRGSGVYGRSCTVSHQASFLPTDPCSPGVESTLYAPCSPSARPAPLRPGFGKFVVLVVLTLALGAVVIELLLLRRCRRYSCCC